MEYTLHSVRKLMIFPPVFKDIITHKLYSRTFSEFFTGSAKLVFSRKKNVKIVHCAFPWQNCVKFPSFYTLSKRMRVALYFLSSLSLSYDFAPTIKKKTWREIWSYIHTHTYTWPHRKTILNSFFCIIHIINICLVIMLNSPVLNGRIVIWMCH